MSDQLKEKEKSLAELMVRVLKEPLKPLDQSIAGLNGALSEIEGKIEAANHTLLVCSDMAEAAAKQSRMAVKSLGDLHDEQSLCVPNLRACIAEHAQAGAQSVEAQLDAHAERGASALAVVADDVLSALAGISQEQRSTAQAIDTMPEHLSRELGTTNVNLATMGQALQEQIRQGQAVLDRALVQGEVQWASANAAIASELKNSTVEIGQLLAHQQHTFQAAHQVMLKDMKDAAGQAQSMMAESLHKGQALQESINNSHAELMVALNQHTELMNTRLDQSQAKVRRLMITTGVILVSMFAYGAYEVLSKFS